MGIIIKFLFKNIWEKKLRTFLIVLSIVLSAAVFFTSIAVSGSLVDLIIEGIRGSIGNSDIIISPDGEKTTSSFFYDNRAKKYNDRLEYVIGMVSGSGTYSGKKDEELNVDLEGIDIDDLKRMTNISILSRENIYPFEGRKIIIGKEISDTYSLNTGDNIEIKIGNTKVNFIICGIAESSGYFNGGFQSMIGVIPKDTMAGFYNARGKVTAVFIKLKDINEKEEMIELLSNEYESCIVEESIPTEELNSETSEITTVFLILSSVVFFMSIFIIYSSFKVITIERLPVIGTFRSIGATKKMTDFLLLAESGLYGIIGGVFGCLLGVGFLYLVSMLMTSMISGSSNMEFKASINFSIIHMELTFLMAFVLCFVSSIVPITRVSFIPIKDVILNTISKPKKVKHKRLVIGLVLLSAAVGAAFPSDDNSRAVFGISGMVLSLVALVVLVPYLTAMFVKLFENMYIFIFGNIGILSAKNLRENKNIINNIIMLAIGISSILMISTIGFNSVSSVTNMYKDTKFDIEMYIWQADRNVERLLQNVDGVESVYGSFETYRIEIVDSTNKISPLLGVDTEKFLDFWNLDSGKIDKAVIEKLDEGKNILLTETLKDMLHVEKNDFIKIKLNDKERKYKVIGFFDNYMSYMRSALISDRYYKSDMNEKEYSEIYIKTNKEPEIVAQTIQEEFKRRNPYIMTKEGQKKQYIEQTKKLVLFMQCFSILALIIGSFGVINNLLISFIERKHSLAVFRSVGMEKRQAVKMIFIESLTGGLIGGILGVLGSMLMIFVAAGVKNLNDIEFPFSSFAIYVIAGTLMMLVASIGPAMKSSKIDLVSSLKYE